MISLDRARECIGRPVIHDTKSEIQGVVEEVTDHDVMVRMPNGERSLCMPEHLTWKHSGSTDLLNAIVADEKYVAAQVFYEDTEGGPIGYIGSSPEANDDGLAHLLYVVLPLVQRVIPASPLADPWLPYSVEEAMGWKSR